MSDCRTSQVNAFLRDSIARGDVAPGDVISANDLARRLGVSRTPVRDAVNQLAVEGLLELRPKAGAVVRTMSMEEFAEYAELRIALEPHVAELAATRITYDEAARICGIVKNMARLSRRMIDEEYPAEVCQELRKLDDDFHHLIHEICGNRTIRKVIDDLKLLTVRQAYPSRRDVSAVATTLIEHWRIAKALERRDPVAARLWMMRQMRRGSRDAINAYRTYLENQSTQSGPSPKAELNVERFEGRS
jgi:DNA-binding GntR family transcriptional regulator